MIAITIPSSDSAHAAEPPSFAGDSLSTTAICAEIERLANAERTIEWLLCRHLAELADRFEQRDVDLGAYADVYQLARLRFGMSVRRVRERVRIGRALRELPRIEQAFVEGALGYAKVREVTRVAEPESEPAWLKSASELPLRALERRVAEAAGREPATSEPAALRWASPRSIEVQLTMPAAAWALLQRAMEGQGSAASRRSRTRRRCRLSRKTRSKPRRAGKIAQTSGTWS